MSYPVKDTEDRLFLIDASSSMSDKIGGSRKLNLVRRGLKVFCLERWPTAYYEWPLRIGIVAFRLLGTPGRAVFDVLVPLNPAPPHLELFRLEGLRGKGGSPLYDGFRYASIVMSESPRGKKRVKFIGDGDLEGPEPFALVEDMSREGVVIDSIEISEKTSELMTKIAEIGLGKYYHVQSLEQIMIALKEP